MNTSSHYPSIELCKKLTEAGFPDETACHFRKSNSDIYEHTFGPWDDESYVCPSVMELLDEMPTLGWDTPKIVKNYIGWYVVYEGENNDIIWEGGNKGQCDTLPDALAEMYLWLKENNYLTK